MIGGTVALLFLVYVIATQPYALEGIGSLQAATLGSQVRCPSHAQISIIFVRKKQPTSQALVRA